MAATIDFTQFRAEEAGEPKRYRFGFYTGPKSYSNFFTNGGTGDPLVPGDLKLGQIHVLAMETAVNAAGAPLQPTYLQSPQTAPAGGAICWFNWNAATEVANGTDLSGYTCAFEAVGLSDPGTGSAHPSPPPPLRTSATSGAAARSTP